MACTAGLERTVLQVSSNGCTCMQVCACSGEHSSDAEAAQNENPPRTSTSANNHSIITFLLQNSLHFNKLIIVHNCPRNENGLLLIMY